MGMFSNPLSRTKLVVEEREDRFGEIVQVSRLRQSYKTEGPSLTQQQFLKESDINEIIARYRVTGLAPQKREQPMFGDFSDLPDFQVTLNRVIEVQALFQSLSSDIRTMFMNDPARFVEFASDEANKPKLQEWGIVAPDPVKDPEPLPPAKPAAEPPKEA